MKKILPILIIITGLSLLYPLQSTIDHSSVNQVISDESLYLTSGTTIKRMSLGLDGLVTDIYWIRTIQYFGRKVLYYNEDQNSPGGYSPEIKMDLLAPLLELIVTIDPQYNSAYRFGAIFLPDRDPQKAIRLLQRGIDANPGYWQLYQDLGYIYWRQEEYEKAADIFEKGSQIPNTPSWMFDMAGYLKIKGGSWDVARKMYKGYLNDEDERVRNQAIARLRQLQAQEELEYINNELINYKARVGHCPSSLASIAYYLRLIRLPIRKEDIPVDFNGIPYASVHLTFDQDNTPVDPNGTPYALDPISCKADLSPQSWIPK